MRQGTTPEWRQVQMLGEPYSAWLRGPGYAEARDGDGRTVYSRVGPEAALHVVQWVDDVNRAHDLLRAPAPGVSPHVRDSLARRLAEQAS